eukprot:m.224745 g.224745  ORF g.224745 m.224745 type:complete len:324 (+) comp11144_c0_seq1:36-1007(+)
MPSHQTCRFYEQKFPEVDDVVMVKVRQIAEMGAYVELLEYDKIEGMILLSELSRRRIRSINKLIRVDRNEPVVVLRVDKEKGYIDLSKRRVSPEEAKKCEEKFNKAKSVNSILRHVAETENVDLEELYKATAWPLETKFGGPGSSYDAFKLALTEDPALPTSVFAGLELPPKLKNELVTNIRRRLTPQPVKIRSDLEVACYSSEGIDAIKDALRAGLTLSTEQQPVKITLIAPPHYVATTVSLDKDVGIALLTEVIEKIKAKIAEKDGVFNVKLSPRAVTETDDKELATMMSELENLNTEVAGDDPEDDVVGMGGPAVEIDDE